MKQDRVPAGELIPRIDAAITSDPD
jgi:hypothetical protein